MLMDLLHGFEVLSTTEETLFNSRNVSRLVQNNLLFVTASSRFPPLDIKNIDAMILMKDLNCLKDEISQLKSDKHVVEQDAELKQLVLDLKKEIHQLIKHVTSAEGLTVPSHKHDISNATSATSFAEVLTKAVDSRAPVSATRKSCSTSISAGSSKAHFSKRKEGDITTAKHTIQGHTTLKLPIVEEEHIQSNYEWKVNKSPKKRRRELFRVGTLPSTNLKAVSDRFTYLARDLIPTQQKQ